MSNKPLVSGIIIFLNGEKFIEEAIESIFAQTYENWELLLVDDGSTDGSTAIALEYAQKYPEKVRYLEHDDHQNRGMSATRNLGIRNAKGEYIAFLDADDVWLPLKLEQQLKTMNSQRSAGVVFGPTQFWYSWNENPGNNKRDSMRKIGIEPNRLYYPPTLLRLLLQKKALTPATCSVLIRREVFEKIGGFEDVFQGCYEDQAFFTKVYLKIPVFVERECWDKYRQHGNSGCAVAEQRGEYHRFKTNPAHLTFLNWIEEYLSKQGVKDGEVWQALQKARWPYKHPVLYSFWHPFKRIRDSVRRRL